jgi:hypothetical protein
MPVGNACALMYAMSAGTTNVVLGAAYAAPMKVAITAPLTSHAKTPTEADAARPPEGGAPAAVQVYPSSSARPVQEKTPSSAAFAVQVPDVTLPE